MFPSNVGGLHCPMTHCRCAGNIMGMSHGAFTCSFASRSRTVKSGSFQRLKLWTILLFILVGLPALVQLGLWLWHPMFYNQFVMHDGLPFFHWWPQGSCYDDRGNAAVADYHRNVLAVFLTANSNIRSSRFCIPYSRQGGAVFPAPAGEDKIDFFVPKSTNTLFVFGADGTRSDFPLAAGEAERVHKLMKPWPDSQPDLVRLLQRVYPEKHPPDCSASLREAIAKLETKGSKQP